MVWIENTEAKRIEFVSNEIKNAYFREIVTADQLVSLLYSAVESSAKIRDYLFTSQDAVVVDRAKRITPFPKDPPVPELNDFFRNCLNEEQKSVIETHLKELCADKGILKEDLLAYLSSFEHTVRGICTNESGQSIKLAALPENWTWNGFPKNFINGLGSSANEGYLDADECVSSLMSYRVQSPVVG